MQILMWDWVISIKSQFQYVLYKGPYVENAIKLLHAPVIYIHLLIVIYLAFDNFSYKEPTDYDCITRKEDQRYYSKSRCFLKVDIIK